MFRWATRIAVNSQEHRRLFPRLVLAYKVQAAWSAPRRYADKSHPNLWLAEALSIAFPRSVFLGVERDPFATVASMIRHKGVRSWHSSWQNLPIPNRFLGITEETAKSYDSLSLATQCALRCKAHHDELQRLKSALRDRMKVISYEVLTTKLDAELQNIEMFLGLEQRLVSPPVQSESMDRWLSDLSNDEISDIKAVVGFEPRNS